MKTALVLFAALALGVVGHAQDTQPVDLRKIIGPNNSFHDPVCGVSLTYPAGWEVTSGMRWGPDYRENTFRFRPLWPAEANPSLYYQAFRPDNPRPADVQAWLREAAAKKEASRYSPSSGYRNVPESMTFTTIGGRPALSYLATFKAGAEQMAEYNLRIVGEKAYVMFFTLGKINDVLSVRDEIDKMAATVQVP